MKKLISGEELVERLLPLSREQLFDNVSLERKQRTACCLAYTLCYDFPGVEDDSNNEAIERAWLITDLTESGTVVEVGEHTTKVPVSFDIGMEEEDIEDAILVMLNYINERK